MCQFSVQEKSDKGHYIAFLALPFEIQYKAFPKGGDTFDQQMQERKNEIRVSLADSHSGLNALLSQGQKDSYLDRIL